MEGNKRMTALGQKIITWACESLLQKGIRATDSHLIMEIRNKLEEITQLDEIDELKADNDRNYQKPPTENI
jgi:hypothetical protein